MKVARVLVAMGLLAIPATSLADPIITFATRSATAAASANRNRPSIVSSSVDQQTVVAGTSDAGPDGWSGASAFLASGTDPSDLWGRGESFGYAETTGWAYGSAGSFYYIGLRLDRPYDFTFHATFSGASDTNLDRTRPDVRIGWDAMLRTGPTGTLYFRDTGNQANALVRTGQLPPGDWQLYVFDHAEAFVPAGGTARALSDYSFSMNFAPASGPAPSPAPEPASMLLLGSGLAGTFAARRRR